MLISFYIPCEKLKPHHPFIERTEIAGGITEELLKVGDTVLNKLRVEKEQAGPYHTLCVAADVHNTYAWGSWATKLHKQLGHKRDPAY